MRKPERNWVQVLVIALVFSIPFVGMDRAIKLAEEWA